jgi:type IV secretory pathway VirB10-like protein
MVGSLRSLSVERVRHHRDGQEATPASPPPRPVWVKGLIRNLVHSVHWCQHLHVIRKKKDREKENERGRGEENNKEMKKEKDKEEKDKGKEKDQEKDKDKEKDKEKEKDKKKGKEHLHAHLCPTPSHPAITLVTSPCRLHRLSLCSH